MLSVETVAIIGIVSRLHRQDGRMAYRIRSTSAVFDFNRTGQRLG